MIFNSLTFLAFLAIVLGLHRLPLPWSVKKFNLTWASYLFYAAWNPPFVILLWISTVVDYVVARAMGRVERKALRVPLLAVSLCTNLGLLGWYKYGGFMLDNFVAMMQAMGVDYHPARPDIILPVGISFYTFQTLSYTIDVYRRTIPPSRSLLDFTLFVSFFPQLVAGPIVRAPDFLGQCRREHVPTGSEYGWGATLLVVGLFCKVILADSSLALIVDRVYGNTGTAGFVDAWAGTLAFAGQIFFDFAGYTTCAIGVAMMVGFWLPDNFRYPYAAVGFTDFWRRWHMSLSTWLRDYLYIPMGGNRSGRFAVVRNLMCTMLIGGLWHGASWHFVIWGGLHGLFLVCERWIKAWWGQARWVMTWPGQTALALLTFVLVCVTWVYFRASSVQTAWHLTMSMAGLRSAPGGVLNRADLVVVGGITGSLLGWHLFMRHRTLEDVTARTWWPVRAAVLAGMLFLLALAPGEDRAFIYFQF